MTDQNSTEIFYHGLTGIQYQIENTYFAKGGEGILYNVQNNSKIVAKIFKEGKRDKEREEKIKYMVQIKLTDGQLEDVTWPQDVIYDQYGFAGYIMPKIERAQSLTALYSDKEYDLRWRLVAAINLCKVIKTVHDIGQVCGDLNPQNICINLDKMDKINGFRVTLVDVDSYHIVTEDRIFRCEVGLVDYLAPEIQRKISNGLTLRNAPLPTYTRETDLFALAVHIFSLLMNGSHPFACAKAGNGAVLDNMQQMTVDYLRDSVVAPQPIENIKEGYFPFYEKRAGITIPLYAPEFSSLPLAVQQLFIRTFVDGDKEPSKRASANEWEEILTQNVNNISSCSQGHYYFNDVSECPFCKIERNIIAAMRIDSNLPLVHQQVIEENKSSAGSYLPLRQQPSDSQAGSYPSLWQQIPNSQEGSFGYNPTEWGVFESEPIKEKNIPMLILELALLFICVIFIVFAIMEYILESEDSEIYSDSEEYYEADELSLVHVELKLVDAGGFDYKLPEDYSWHLYYEQDNEVGENSEYCYFFSDRLTTGVFLPAGHYSAMLVGESYDEDEEDDWVEYTSFDVPSTSTDISNGMENVTVNVVID